MERPLIGDDFKRLANYGANPGNARHLLRMAFLSPQNTPLIFDLNNSEFAVTPLGLFFIHAAKIVEKIIQRNLVFFKDAYLTENEAIGFAIHSVGFAQLPAWQDKKARREKDFQLSSNDLTGFTQILELVDIIKALDFFVWVSHSKEQANYINDFISIWKKFCAEAGFHPACRDLPKNGKFLNELAAHGLEAAIEKRLQHELSKEEINEYLAGHVVTAQTFGIEPRVDKIRNILRKYEGLMRPVVLPYRKLAPEITKARRAEFGRRQLELADNKYSFLQSLSESELKFELYKLGIPLNKFSAMRQAGNFGQQSASRNPHMLTVEHMTPLQTGDNFHENFALLTAEANNDTGLLIQLQTDFLPGDSLSRDGDRVTLERVGTTIEIIALRPPYIKYGNERRFPRFVRHPNWDVRLA